MPSAQTAAEAFDRYRAFYADGRLMQSSWHFELDGRQLACGLGVLGDEINTPSKCPAQIMPRWLAQMVPYFFDNQVLADATAWGWKFYAELKRIDGKVPFSVVHDWQANVVCLLAIEVAEKLKLPVEPHLAVQQLHIRAMRGDVAKKDEWAAVLRPAYAYVYANTFGNANANVGAYANIYANANAYVDAYDYGNANADVEAYADGYSYANSNDKAYAKAYKIAVKQLADGMIECLRRVPTAAV